MTGNEDNLGFLATGSGVEQFQLSLGGWFIRGNRSSLAAGTYGFFDSMSPVVASRSNSFAARNSHLDPPPGSGDWIEGFACRRTVPRRKESFGKHGGHRIGRRNGMKQHRQTAIAPLGLERLPAFGRIEIASRFCSMAERLGTILQGGHPEHGTDKAFRNPAPGAAAIPGSPANPGLCSSRAVGVWWPELPATSPSFCAIFAPASRSSSLAALSPLATVTEMRENAVFTYTQTSIKISHFCACIYGPND
jgi:hypothetical protein